MENQDAKIQELQEQINELRSLVRELQTESKNNIGHVNDIVLSYSRHQHSGADGTKRLTRGIEKLVESGAIGYIGNGGIAEITIPDTGSGEVNELIIAAGRDQGISSSPLNHSINSVLSLNNQPTNAFLFGYTKPAYQNVKPSSGLSVTIGGTTLLEGSFEWATNELTGAYIDIFDSSDALITTRQIRSNTVNTITIWGTFPLTVSNLHYLVWVPIYLGAAQNPWRQGYFIGEDVSAATDGSKRRALRLGMGTTSGADVVGIYFGTKSPQGAVTANVGSIYLRQDGAAGTSLYVKEAGAGNVGWVGK